MPITKLRPSFTFTEDRLEELKSVVPEAFADGRINWETLREALSEHLEEPDAEHFGFFWPGKREARRPETPQDLRHRLPCQHQLDASLVATL